MKKVISLVLAATMLGTISTGCGNKENSNSGNSSSDSETNNNSGSEESASDEKITFYQTGGKTKTLNPHVYETSSESGTMAYIYANLYEIIVNEAGDSYEFYPNHAAELPTMSEDGLTWTVPIRNDVKWSDGTPVTAETYEYTYKMLLDPSLKNTMAEIFFNIVPVENAQAYFNGECTWEEVGIKADGNNLVFNLRFAISEIDFVRQFIGGYETAAVHPEMYESCFNADRTENTYGTSLETTPSSGAYILTEWQRDQYKRFEKNPDSPLASIYTPDVIDSRVVEDSNTAMTLFENGDIDYTTVSSSNYEKYVEDPRIAFSESSSVNHMYINATSETNPILGNNDFRKALYYGTDRNKITETIYKTALPAPYYISSYQFLNEQDRYRESEGAKELVERFAGDNAGFNPELAKEYFDKAYTSNGGTPLVVQMQYFDTSDSMKMMAEYLEEEYEGLFGLDKIDVQLQAVPWQTVYDNMKAGKFDLAFGSYGISPLNPWAGLEIYKSEFPGKNDKMYNEEFDTLWDRTVAGDLIFKEKEKLDALVRMEEIMFEETCLVPLYQNRSVYIFSDRVELITGGKYLPSAGFGILQSKIGPKAE